MNSQERHNQQLTESFQKIFGEDVIESAELYYTITNDIDDNHLDIDDNQVFGGCGTVILLHLKNGRIVKWDSGIYSKFSIAPESWNYAMSSSIEEVSKTAYKKGWEL